MFVCLFCCCCFFCLCECVRIIAHTPAALHRKPQAGVDMPGTLQTHAAPSIIHTYPFGCLSFSIIHQFSGVSAFCVALLVQKRLENNWICFCSSSQSSYYIRWSSVCVCYGLGLLLLFKRMKLANTKKKYVLSIVANHCYHIAIDCLNSKLLVRTEGLLLFVCFNIK